MQIFLTAPGQSYTVVAVDGDTIVSDAGVEIATVVPGVQMAFTAPGTHVEYTNASTRIIQNYRTAPRNGRAGGKSFRTEVYDSYAELPNPGESGVFYFIPSIIEEGKNTYDEFVWVESASKYELIGTAIPDTILRVEPTLPIDTLRTNTVYNLGTLTSEVTIPDIGVSTGSAGSCRVIFSLEEGGSVVWPANSKFGSLIHVQHAVGNTYYYELFKCSGEPTIVFQVGARPTDAD